MLEQASIVDASRDEWKASEVTKLAVTMLESSCLVLPKGEPGSGRACTCMKQKIVEPIVRT